MLSINLLQAINQNHLHGAAGASCGGGSGQTDTLHPVLLKLSQEELQELETLASHYELTQGELISMAFRHFVGELDIVFIPG